MVNSEVRSSRWLIALAVVVLAIIVFLIYGQYSMHQDLVDRVEEEDLKVARLTARLESLRQLSQKEDEMRAQMALLDQLMPCNPLEDDLIRSLQRSADAAEISMMHIRFGERIDSIDSEDYVEMPLNLSFEGRYVHLVQLLSHIENSPRAIRIDEVDMGRGRAELPYLSISVRGSAFYAGK